MTTPELTEEDAAKLFNDVSEAIREEDSTKLSALLVQESPEEEQPNEETHEETPEEEVEQEEDKEESAEEADNKQETEEEDPLAKLKAEIEELRKAHHTFSSQVGRVPGIQRRLAEYDRQLAELKSATSGKPSDKTDPEIEAALKDLEDTDPALAKTIKDVVNKAKSQVDTGHIAREIERVQSLREIEYAEYASQQKDILLSKYPNAPEVFKSQHWQSWKKEQPEHIRNLATADSADAVIMALDMFKKDMIQKYPELNKQTQTEEEQPQVNERAQQIEEERRKKQTSSAAISNGKPPVRGKEPANPQALFEQYSEQVRKEITGK